MFQATNQVYVKIYSMPCNTRYVMNNTGYTWFFIWFYILVGGKPTPLKNMSQSSVWIVIPYSPTSE